MRLFVALPALALSLSFFQSSDASAEASKSAAPAIELVDVFNHTGQALIYDQADAEYVLLRSGSRFRGFKVGSITAAQIELFRASNTRVRFVITKAAGTKANKSDSPVDPYANSTPASTTTDSPVDPYANTKPAPPPEVKVVRAPVSSRPSNKPSKARITRGELDRALDDLDAISREVSLELTTQGVRVTAVGEGTLPYRVGLRRGDIIASIAGIKTTRLEDGADVFVRLSSAKKFEISLIRDKEVVRISVAVQ